MKRAVVTGAAGFIGCHVVRELLGDGVEVRALIRPGERTDNLEGLEIERMEGDLLDEDAMARAVDGVDAVFHLAAIYSIWMEDWSRIYEVNLQGSRNVLWAALRRGTVERVVYTSSIAAIGIAPGRELSTEATPFNQYTLGNHYVLTKYLSQQEALGFARNGLDLVVVNPAFPFGPRDIVPTPTGQMIVDILKGKNRFCFDGGLNVVDVRDVARGHVLAARRGRTGERYILGNSNLTLHELMLLVYRAAGIPPGRIVRVPVALARLGAAGMTLWANRVSHRPPVSSPPEIDYSAQYLFFDTSKARGELGLRPRPVEESIAEAISFFRANGYV